MPTMKELADQLTAKAVESALAEEKASREPDHGQHGIVSMYSGQTKAYMEAAAMTGETTEEIVFEKIENAIYL